MGLGVAHGVPYTSAEETAMTVILVLATFTVFLVVDHFVHPGPDEKHK